MLKKSASLVLASLRGSTYRSVRLASSLAAALLDGFLSILRLLRPSPYLKYFTDVIWAHRVFPQPAKTHVLWRTRWLFCHEMCATILLIAVLILLLAEWFGFSIARNLKLRSLRTHVLEILLHRARPFFTQDEIVRHGASLIAMAFNQHRLAPVG